MLYLHNGGSHGDAAVTCNRFDDFISLVVTAVASLEGDLVRCFVRGLKPRLQKSAEVSHHVLLESLARSSHLESRGERGRVSVVPSQPTEGHPVAGPLRDKTVKLYDNLCIVACISRKRKSRKSFGPFVHIQLFLSNKKRKMKNCTACIRLNPGIQSRSPFCC